MIQIDPDYTPDPVERRRIYGVTFEQGRNNLKITKDELNNIVSQNKDLPESAKIDLVTALITLKYTQSNSVCYVKNGQTIGVGAGQQSRIHCTRLAGDKADNWLVRASIPRCWDFSLWTESAARIGTMPSTCIPPTEYEDVLAEGVWQQTFKVKPEVLTREERKAWIAQQTGVSCGSDAFFPFGDNVERARKSGVSYIAEPGGSIRDDNVIAACDKYGIVLCFTGNRLFHH